MPPDISLTDAATQPAGDSAEHEIISQRLAGLIDEMLAGRAPNAGRFCGNCYHPLAAERDVCPHCGVATSQVAPVDKVPSPVIAAHRTRRSREGLVVRTFAWGGLTLGVTLSLVPLAFAGVHWWTLASFFGLLALFYLLSANLANSVGDALGYRWGIATFNNRWRRFVVTRDADPS